MPSSRTTSPGDRRARAVPSGALDASAERGVMPSVWAADTALTTAEPLTIDLEADVCVIGAGIAGMSVAYQLVCAGRRVVVLDDGAVGGGETQRTTAHLSNAIDDRYTEIARLHGAAGARAAAESHTAAIAAIEATVAREEIDCAFARLDGYLFSPAGSDGELLARELEAARAAGIEVEWAARVPSLTGDHGRCLRFPRQGQFHPLRYLRGLAAAIVRRGGRIATDTRVVGVDDGRPVQVATERGPTVRAGAAVVATNSPVTNLVALHTKQAPYTSYAIALDVVRGAVVSALYWDTVDPYHYVRLAPAAPPGAEGELLVVGGEDHKAAQASDRTERFARLETWARANFPGVGGVRFRWVGQVMETLDGLAYIGRNPGARHVYVATGDSGMGMTHGTIAGLLLGDLLQGRDNPWRDVYRPGRVRLGAAGDFARENLNVAAQYGAWLSPGDVASADAIPPGGGAILREGLQKIAVYRDRAGALHRFSAACTHLGCVVAWNDAGQTWDCPCHGSRFNPDGTVATGPANRPLTRLD